MLPLLALVTMVTTAEPAPAPPSARGLKVRLSAGSFLGAGWGTDTFRLQVQQLEQQGLDFSRTGAEPEAGLLLRTTPVAGPLLTLHYGGALAESERTQLMLTSALQAVGLVTLGLDALGPSGTDEAPSALELSISPLVAGRLGLSLTLQW